MPITKRLFIKASNNYDSDFQIIPINTEQPLVIDSDIGLFKLFINIRNFDGSKPHLSNSLYNVQDKYYLNGEKINFNPPDKEPLESNLRLYIEFTPYRDIKGSALIFGNDFTYSIKPYVPTTLLNTGLKLFNWFINDSVKGDAYNDQPYLYGPGLNSFTYMGIKNDNKSVDPTAKKPVENLSDQLAKVPNDPNARKKFFRNFSKCDKFTYKKGVEYIMQFDTNYLKLADSKYSLSIPHFDFDISHYSNDVLNNVNWVIKDGGYEGVGAGDLGLVINFAVLSEEAE
ncbi:hypothetical protein SBY92_003990 [Candida maltosa Xu316]|uniref:Domain of unknown function at the cortex 1 domain-containing protein n=1 Tax=Candida maltosa (strain Xu316) TaxID=1245528 RepID=M3HMN0_CANMX|nr:hypothetical protein G210_0693 [Candida maltosa Xu316]